MTICPFCAHDPFHYENNGCGMEAVAVTCCELGDQYFRGARKTPEEVSLGWDEFTEIAATLSRLRHRLNEAEDTAALEGSIVVPAEPTTKMFGAFISATLAIDHTDLPAGAFEAFCIDYRAMLAAAPSVTRQDRVGEAE